MNTGENIMTSKQEVKAYFIAVVDSMGFITEYNENYYKIMNGVTNACIFYDERTVNKIVRDNPFLQKVEFSLFRHAWNE